MKKNSISALLLFAFISIYSAPFELGIEFGSPTGISAKYWLNQRSALDFGLGFTGDNYYDKNHDYYDNDRMHFHADYQLHRFDLIPVDQGRLGLYYGLGLKITSGYDSDLGVRVPLGAQYDFQTVPLAIFLELTPVLELTDTHLDIDPALGIRYVFGKKSGGSKKTNHKKSDKDDEDKEKPKVKLQW